MKTVLRLALLGALAITCLAGTASGAAGACPTESLRDGYGAYLPDCRAYEQATATNKDGTNPEIAYNTVQAAVDGSGVTFYSQAGLPGAVSGSQVGVFLATRHGESWSTQGLLPAATLGQSNSALGWTPDLAEMLGTATRYGTGTAVVARATAGIQTQAVTPYLPLEFPEFSFVGASTNDSALFFEESDGAALTPEATGGKSNLYMWDRETNTLHLVGLLPESECSGSPCAPVGGSFAGPYNWWNADTARGGANLKYFTQAEHAISANGQAVYFTAGESGQIYLRKDPASASATTVRVSASQKTNGSGPGGTDPNGPRPAAFMMATPSGSQALFTSKEELTNNANTGTSDEGNDLYRYDAASGRLTDLVPDATSANGADIVGVLGVSEDGSYVYFAANGDLDGSGPATTGDCGSGEFGLSGECSLYVWHDNEVRFIATLDAAGASIAGANRNKADSGGLSDATDWAPIGIATSGGAPVTVTSRVSADGDVLVFRSQRKLTAYENGGVPEYYRYQTATGTVTCVTCNPSGASPTAPPVLQRPTALLGAPGLAPIQTRNLSSSGQEFFFQTREALLPSDTNGVSDVYEWEADGAGTCESDTDGGGCLYLISTGKSPDASSFADASGSGEDVFIFTDQALVGQDEDQLVDVYDVRVNGGLASQRGGSSASCAGEGCKATPLATLAAASPGSMSFTGAGNNEAQVHRCAILAKRVGRLRRNAKSLRSRVKEMRGRIHRLWHDGKRHRARRIRREARALRQKRHRIRVKVMHAAKAAKKCRSSDGRVAK